MEPRVGARLGKLMKGGNRYDAAITVVSGDEVRIIIRETFAHPDNFGKVSFPGSTAGRPADVRPDIRGSALRYDDEGGERGARGGSRRRSRSSTPASRSSPPSPSSKRSCSRNRRSPMGEAQRKRLDHVVLPRRLPGLALLERYFPSPADNQLDAELTSYARSRRHHPRSVGRHRLDRASRGRGRHAGGGRRSEPLRPAGGAGLPAGPGAGRHRCRLRPAGRLAPRRRAAAPAHRGAVRHALRDLPAAGGRRAVHLAPRRRRTGAQDLPLRELRHRHRRAGRAGGRRSTTSTWPSWGSSGPARMPGGRRPGRRRARRRRPVARRGGRPAAGAGRPDRRSRRRSTTIRRRRSARPASRRRRPRSSPTRRPARWPRDRATPRP